MSARSGVGAGGVCVRGGSGQGQRVNRGVKGVGFRCCLMFEDVRVLGGWWEAGVTSVSV